MAAVVTERAMATMDGGRDAARGGAPGPRAGAAAPAPARPGRRFAAAAAGIRDRFGPVSQDAALALALAAVSGWHVAAGRPTPAVWVWLVLLLCPIAVRRRAPLLVFGALVALCTLAFAPLPAGLGPAPTQVKPVMAAVLLFALATVATHRPRRVALVCAVVLGGWATGSLFRWSSGGPSLSALALGVCAVAAAVLAGAYLQTRRDFTAALGERAERLEFERDQQARLAVIEERTRIARELHDIVSHSLSVMVALADGAVATAPEPGRGLMRQVGGVGRQAIGEMRSILGLLREGEAPDWSPQPGLAQIEELLEEARAAGLRTAFEVAGVPRELSAGLQLTVYRIVQEALTNVRKHAAGATVARVRLCYNEEGVLVEVADDGRAAPSAAPGHGLTGMGERAAAFAGSLRAGPGPDGGWLVRVRLAAADGDDVQSS